MAVSVIVGNVASAAAPGTSRSAQLHWFNTVVEPLNAKIYDAQNALGAAFFSNNRKGEALAYATWDHYLVQSESALAEISKGHASVSAKAPIVVAFKRVTLAMVHDVAVCSKMDLSVNNSAFIVPCDDAASGLTPISDSWNAAVAALTGKPTAQQLGWAACDAVGIITSDATNYSTLPNSPNLVSQRTTFETDGAKSDDFYLVEAATQAETAPTEGALANAVNAAQHACYGFDVGS